MAVSGVCLGIPEENSGKITGTLREYLSQNCKMLEAEVQKPTPNSEMPKKPSLHELFREVGTNFFPLPYSTSQEPNGNCSERLVQMNCFVFGVDFWG